MTLRTVLTLVTALGVALPATADNSGSYLAARSAIIANDFAEAAEYYSRALARDPANPALLENAMTAYLGIGNAERAVPAARRMMQTGAQSQVAGLILLGDDAKTGNWDSLLADLQAGQTVGPLFDGLIAAWAEVGAGRMSEALDAFDEVASNAGVEAFGLYHKALALASVGDFESAAEIFAGEAGTMLRLTRRGIIAYAQILSQLERNEDAIDLIDQTFGSVADPTLVALRSTLEAGDSVAFDTVQNPADGVAEVYFSIANALAGEAQDSYTLLYGRMTLHLRPDHVDALLLTAELLENLERYDLATEVYNSVPADDPSFHAAELGRAAALRQSGNTEAAIEVLRGLQKSHGDLPLVHVTLGDTLRGLDRYDEAIPAYDRALSLIETPEEQHWVMFFARGIAHERTDNWPQAEADFRKALELRPEQPQVLNYLGYSFLEMQTNMEEALDLIERAVALRPDSGYIVDSLGWGLYRLGRYEEAVGHMERAVELMPVDPVVNDHLGDVYWAVGREREAEFQWHRALSFIDEDGSSDADPDRIRRKLEIGLDAVLEEEGAPPLEVANDDG
ncbi:tetratricopeptide repeat protein [Alphaproteobacteria bacterium GH1-50]|uniref:Tetratricopeptide repeat protein n=1 Tax=Kangsaoukella pontilimi TaxID=2691042 RepID=A0A7C9MXR5_9RHOB|nr:tetratricopeptide repeat protein [Kangsaoukella pontilimi]MXQ09280.1 tetratricopeptide repeat protein [Kangsaoukella pontilimi]